MITKLLFDLMSKSICTQTLLSYYCRMMSKWVAMMVYTGKFRRQYVDDSNEGIFTGEAYVNMTS